MSKEFGEDAGFVHELAKDFDIPDRPLDLVERMTLLRQTFSFAEGNIDGIADLAKEVRESRIPKGTQIWRTGDVANYFLMPLKGKVHCEAPGQSFKLGPSDSIGALDAMSDQPRWYNVSVAEDLVAFHVERDMLFDVLEDHFDMAMGLLRTIARGTLALYDLKAARASAQ